MSAGPVSWFRRPRILRVEHLYAPIALAGGNTPIRVVVEGTGTLEVGTMRRRFRNGLDAVFFVPVSSHLTVRARRTLRVLDLLGIEQRTLALTVLAPAPAPVDVEVLRSGPVHLSLAMPRELRPAAVELCSDVLWRKAPPNEERLDLHELGIHAERGHQ